MPGWRARREAAKAWDAACGLWHAIRVGEEWDPIEVSYGLLDADESCCFVGWLSYARLHGELAHLNNHQVPGLIEQTVRIVASQWRDHSKAEVFLTNKRILCRVGDDSESFWHEKITHLEVDLNIAPESDASNWHFVLYFEEGAPLRLAGLAAPWCALMVGRIWRGTDVLQLSLFAPLAE